MEEETTRSELGLSLIKQLASCDNLVRDKALSQLLNSWLTTQTQVPEDLMKKLWKGLFYCVWHADKSPAQSQLADKLSSSLLDLDLPVSIHFLSVFLVTIRREWSGIDVLRLDKFYLLIRRFLFNFFALLKKNSWDLNLTQRLVRVFEERVFFAEDKFQGNGVKYHIATVLVDEITGFLPIRTEIAEVVFGLFVSVMGKSPDKVLLGKIKSSVFDVLVKKGRDFLVVKKSGVDLDSGSSDVGILGSIALSMGFSSRFYEMGSSPDCCQGNRKVIFGLHEEFLKLEKDFASSGIDLSDPNFIKSAEEQEVPELIPIETEEGVALRRCEKKNKKKKKKKQKQSQKSESVIEFDESAISNLQQQFEKIAAEAGLEENDVPSSCDSPNSGAKSAVSKKRKRAKLENGKKSQEDANGEITAKSVQKKKVKFSMKSNLVWKPQNPLPPQSLRLPPSATPRGSALKKGVPAGPIREVGPTQQPKRTKVRVVSVKKARKKVVKRLKKKSA